jgi:ABC-type protease/lipase transport system fused ATPase/permease subunit
VVGDAEAFAELGQSFVLAMGTGVACIYIVLVLLFHAWVQPVTILGALLLSMPGAILALFVTGTDLSHAGHDRHDHADGHRHQELHPAGGVRLMARASAAGAVWRPCSTPATSAPARSS